MPLPLARVLAEWQRSEPGERQVDEAVGRDRRSAAEMVGDTDAPDRPADRDRMRLALDQVGSLSAFATQMDLAARAAATRHPPDRVRELRASLTAVTARALAANVPPGAIGVLAMAGYHQRATDLAAMVTPESRSEGYYRIAVALQSGGHVEAADTAAGSGDSRSQIGFAREAGMPIRWRTSRIRSARTGRRSGSGEPSLHCRQ